MGTLPRPPALRFLLSAGCLLCLDISWLGFGLCLRILFAPCGCRHSYCGPHCGRMSARVLASNWFFPFRGPPHISCLFLSLRPCRSRSPIPSLAPSWWSPCPLMQWALPSLCGYVLACHPLFLCIGLFCRSRSQYCPSCAVSSLTGSVLCERLLLLRGVSPFVGFRRRPWGSRWLHLYRLTPDLVSLRDFAMRYLELRSVFHTFSARRSSYIPGDYFVSFTDI